MNKKVLIKLCSILLITALFISIMLNFESLATEDSRFNFNNITNKEGSQTLNTQLESSLGTVLVIARYVTTTIAIIILIIIAMKYMISAPGERADIKKHAIPYVIGVIILFGATGIITIIGKIANVFN